MRDSFIFYRSFHEAIKELTTEQQAMVVLAIMQYQFDGAEPTLEGVSKAIFTLIKPQLDANNTRYANGCKGGAPKGNTNAKKQPKNNQKTTKKQANENANENDNVNDKKENKKEKIHFAEFVAITNAEYEKLCSTYGREFADQCIEVLDNYKGSKGKKYKDDYRAILSWVVDRVKQNNLYNEKHKNREQAEIDAFMEKTAREWGIG